MEDNRLTIFLRVVRDGSFSAAAAALGITQPSVSQNIAELERQFGLPLFQRTRSGVIPTPAGQALLPYARDIVRRYREAGILFSHFEELSALRHLSVCIPDGMLSRIAPRLTEYLRGVLPQLRVEICAPQALADGADADLSVDGSGIRPLALPANSAIVLLCTSFLETLPLSEPEFT